jgi:hypothetical protein
MLLKDEEIKKVSDNLQRCHKELIDLGNALEAKKKAFAKTQARFQEMMKLAREGKQDEALKLFAPEETAELEALAQAVGNKENEFNHWGMQSRGIDQLIQNEKVRLEAAKLGTHVVEI